MQKLFSISFILLVAVLVLLNSCNRNRIAGGKLLLEPLETNNDASIRALSVIDANVVWASGSSGTYLLSTDGGNSWKSGQVEGAENDDFRSIFGWDSQHAMVFGTSGPGRGYYTSTAGEEWDIFYEDDSEGIFFNSLKFADNFNGLALSDAIDSVPYLIRTRDGGIVWERVAGLPLLLDKEYHFAASNSCIEYISPGNIWIATGGGGARIIFSDDDGLTWRAVPAGITHNSQSSGIFSVSFLDVGRGVVVGGTYDNPSLNDSIAAYTIDGGNSWLLSDKMPAGYRSCAIWLTGTSDIVLAVGKTGWDYSEDYGRSWRFLSDSGYYTARSIPGTKSGFAAGSGGRIARFEFKDKR